MKVYLRCIYRNNLGDDLFIRTICSRYPDVSFTALSSSNVRISPPISNLRVFHVHPIVYRALRKVSFTFNSTHILENLLISQSDLVTAIGGSLFMENKRYKDTLKPDKYYNTYWFQQVKKPLYIIGSNIGPVYNDHYIQKIEQIFAKAEDVCLRDTASLAYTSNPRVRVAPDVIFGSISETEQEEHEGRTAVISVISCEQKGYQMRTFNTEKYRNAMLDLIRSLINDSYNVILYSFCKEEGDEDEIRYLKEAIGNTPSLTEYFYRGNIDEALSVLNNSDLIFGTRFHANVIGFALNKTVVPIIYNDKTRNLLKDISFEGSYIDIEQNIYPSYEQLMSNRPVSADLIARLRKDADLQFKGLDQKLKTR